MWAAVELERTPREVVDLLVVLVFAAVGRRNHGEADALTGIVTTAWPFVVGAIVGWIVLVVMKRLPGRSLTSGVIVWLTTVIVGMILRQVSGHGTAVAFVIVALAFNGACMLGWRLVARVLERRRA